MKKFLAVVLAMVLSMSMLAGCGSKESEKLVVGTNLAFPPFEMVNDAGEPDGFDIALIKAIGEKLGMEVEIQDMEFGAIIAAIGTKIDCSIAAMTVTEERKQSVDFTDAYYEAVQYVLVAEGSSIATAADLVGKNIGVQLGTTGDYIAQEIEGANVQAYDKAVYAVSDLLNGKVDCVIVDKNPALVYESNNAGKVVALEGSQFDFATEEYAIAVKKGSDLTEKMNKALEELKADGTYDELVKKYIEGAE